MQFLFYYFAKNSFEYLKPGKIEGNILIKDLGKQTNFSIMNYPDSDQTDLYQY